MKKFSTYLLALVLLLCLALPAHAAIWARDLPEGAIPVLEEEAKNHFAGKLIRGTEIQEGTFTFSYYEEEYDVEHLFTVEYNGFSVGNDPSVTVELKAESVECKGYRQIELPTTKAVAVLPDLPAVELTFGDGSDKVEEALSAALAGYPWYAFEVETVEYYPIGTDVVEVTLSAADHEHWDNYAMPTDLPNAVKVSISPKELTGATVRLAETEYTYYPYGYTFNATLEYEGLVGGEQPEAEIEYSVYDANITGANWPVNGKWVIDAGSYRYDVESFKDNSGRYTLDPENVAGANYYVNPIELPVTAYAPTVTYDGQPKTYEVQGAQLPVNSGVRYNGSLTMPTEAGEYEVTLDISGSNYMLPDGWSDTLTIEPATVKIVAYTPSLTYNGKDRKDRFMPRLSCDVPAFDESMVSFTWDATEVKDVGEYRLQLACDNPNYQFAMDEFVCEITPCSVKVTLQNRYVVIGDKSAWPYNPNGHEELTVNYAPRDVNLVVHPVAVGFDPESLQEGEYDYTVEFDWEASGENPDNYIYSVERAVVFTEYAETDARLTPASNTVLYYSTYFFTGDSALLSAPDGYEVNIGDGWAEAARFGDGALVRKYYLRETATGKVSCVEEEFSVHQDNAAPTIEFVFDRAPVQKASGTVVFSDDMMLASCTNHLNEQKDLTGFGATGHALTLSDLGYGEYTFSVTDIFGNTTTATLVVDWTDSTPPHFEWGEHDNSALQPGDSIGIVSFYAWDKNDAGEYTEQIVLNFSDGSSWNIAKEWFDEELHYVHAVNGTFTCTVTDSLGNQTQSDSLTISNWDAADPVLVLAYEDVLTNEEGVLVTATVINDEGIDEERFPCTVYYNEDPAIEARGNNTFLITQNGTFEFWAKDASGNESSRETVTITCFDNEPPVVNFTYDTTVYSNEKVEIAYTVEDQSPCTLFFGADVNSAAELEGNKAYPTENGTYAAYAIDKYGNKSDVVEITVSTIDKVAPGLTLERSNNHTATKDLYIIATIENLGDVQSPYALYVNQVMIMPEGYVDNYHHEVNANGTYVFTVKDAAGNETTQSIKIGNYDTQEPIADRVYLSPEEFTQYDVAVVFKLRDEPAEGQTDGNIINWSQVEVTRNGEFVMWEKENDDVFFTAEENGIYEVKFADFAGNEGSLFITVENIDRDAPELTFTVDETPAKEATISFECTDEVSGIVYVEIKGVDTLLDDANAPEEKYTGTMVVNQNVEYAFVVKDAAGHVTEKTVTVDWLDHTKPVLTVDYDATTPATQVELTFTVTDENDAGEVAQAPADGYLVYMAGGIQVENPCVVTENGTYSFYTEDAVGNTSDVLTVEITNIDRNAPAVTVEYDTTEPTNGTVTVTYAVKDENEVTVYFVDGSGNVLDASETAEGSFTASENGEYKIYAVDAAENQSDDADIVIDNIFVDDVKISDPVYAEDPTNAEAIDVTVTVTPALADENGNQGDFTKNPLTTVIVNDELVQLGEMAADGTYTVTFPVKDNGDYTVTASDKAGNVGEITFSINVFDRALPELTSKVNVTEATNEAVVISVTADDEGVGSGKLTVILPDEEEVVLASGETVDFTAEESGEYTFTVVDLAGNKNALTVVIENIDKTVPTAQLTAPEGAATNGEVTLAISANDAGDQNTAAAFTGVESIELYHNGELKETFPGTQTAADVTANGTYYIVAIDLAGNETKSNEVEIDWIDVTAPVVEVTGHAPTAATSEDVTVSFAITDENNDETAEAYIGVQSIVVTFEDGTDQQLDADTREFTALYNGVYTIMVTDLAGNVSDAAEVEVKNIDQVKPTIEGGELEPATATNGEVVISFSHDDEGNDTAEEFTGVVKLTVEKDGGEAKELAASATTYTVTENGVYTFTVTDMAGNVCELPLNVTVNNIDNQKPELTFGDINTEPTNGKVEIVFTTVDNGNVAQEGGVNTAEEFIGVAEIEVKYGDEPYDMGLGNEATSYTVSENGVYTFRVTDKAGNQAEFSWTVDNIDRTKPTFKEGEHVVAGPTNEDVVVKFQTADTGFDAENGNATNPEKVGVAGITVQHESDAAAADLGADATSFTASKNGTYTIVVTDKADNSEAFTVVVENIDRVVPTVNWVENNPNEATNGEVVITFTHDDEGADDENNAAAEAFYGVAKVTVQKDYGEAVELNVADTTYTVTENGMYTFIVYDLAGNESEELDVVVNNIDNQKPTLTFGDINTEPTNEDVEILFTTADTGNTAAEDGIPTSADFIGVAEIEVKYEDGEYAALGAEATSYFVSENGDYTFRVTDMAGNSDEFTWTVDNIDYTKPTFAEGEHVVAGPTMENVVVNFTTGDEGWDNLNNATNEEKTGVASITVKHEGEEEAAELGADATAFTAKLNGTYTIVVTDKAGNSETFTVVVDNIDRVKPTIAWTENTPADATNGTVTIKYTHADLGEDEEGFDTNEEFIGVAKVTVQKNDGEVEELDVLATEYTVSTNGIYTFTVTDKAGNVGDVLKVTVDNIDNVQPKLDFAETTPAQNTATNGVVTINFTTGDSGADVEGAQTNDKFVGVESIFVTHASFEEPVELAVDATTFDVTVNGEYTFTLTDLAGNVAEFKTTILNIDHTAPVAAADYAKNYRTSDDGVVITLTATDAGEDNLGLSAAVENYGLAKIEVTFNGRTSALDILGADNKNVTAVYTAKANGEYTFTFTDMGGNVTTKKVTMRYIDDEAPEFTDVGIGGNRLNLSVADNSRLDRVEVKHLYSDEVTTFDVYGKKNADMAYGLGNAGYYVAVVYDEAGNSTEVRRLNVDNDDDGLSDQWENYVTHTDPNNPDTDADGLNDGQEVQHHTDPFTVDTDGDGLTDGQEVGLGLNPTTTDTDGDGINDYMAVQLGILGLGNELNTTSALILGNSYTAPGATMTPGAFGTEESVNAMLNGLAGENMAADGTTGDMEANIQAVRSALRRSTVILVQFNANTGDGLALVNNYLVQFNRHRNAFNIAKSYDLSELLGEGEYIVLTNADGSLALAAAWDKTTGTTTSDVAILSLVNNRAGILANTNGATGLTISENGGKVAYAKGNDVTMLELKTAQNMTSTVMDLAGLSFINDTLVAVLNNQQTWGLKDGEWSEMSFAGMVDAYLDMAQRTNTYRKVLLPGADNSVIELDAVISVLMQQGDIAFKMGDMKRAEVMFDLSKVK